MEDTLMRGSKRVVSSVPLKHDGWLVSVLSVTVAIEVIAAVALMAIGPSSLWLIRIIAVLLGASAILIVWSLSASSYRVVGSDLEIHSGPLRTRVSIATITSVAPSHSANAAMALSTSSLDLRCTNPAKHVLVSPEEPAAFIGALKNVKPKITVV